MKPEDTNGAADSTTRKKIDDMLAKIKAENLLNRIYRFLKYIYIHQT